MSTKPVSSDPGADATRTVPALTPWFPGSVKPARVGVYETRVMVTWPIARARWDGKRWICLSGLPLLNQLRFWRGLASDPSKINRR